MATFYGVSELRRADDWRIVVGDRKWQPTRSAFELAHKWHDARGFPDCVQQVLGKAGSPLDGLTLKYGMVELPTFLDTLKAPSRTDVMLYCDARDSGPVVIAVEGKADEPFADPVTIWVRNGTSEPTASRRRRLQYLSDLLGVQIDENADYGYQLVHRTACVVSECMLQGAQVGLMLVHSFSERNATNWTQFRGFAASIGIAIDEGEKDQVKGPVLLGPRKDVAVYLAWVRDSCRR